MRKHCASINSNSSKHIHKSSLDSSRPSSNSKRHSSKHMQLQIYSKTACSKTSPKCCEHNKKT